MRCEFELATSSALPSSLATKSNPTTATQSPGIVRGFFVLDVRNIIASMTPKELEQWEEDLRAAELALKAAQTMLAAAGARPCRRDSARTVPIRSASAAL